MPGAFPGENLGDSLGRQVRPLSPRECPRAPSRSSPPSPSRSQLDYVAWALPDGRLSDSAEVIASLYSDPGAVEGTLVRA